MTAEIALQRRMNALGAIEPSAEHSRGYPLLDRVPRRVDRLGAVIRMLPSDAFGPRAHAVSIVHFQQEDPALRHDAGGDPEWFLQRKAQLAQYDPVDDEHWYRG